MWNLIINSIVYIACAICIPVMKKIEPDNNWYPVYLIVVLFLFTVFIVIYLQIQYGQLLA